MKKIKEEPAQKLLTMHPAVETTPEKEGFLSALYRPKADAYPGKVLILTGGSDGLFSLTQLIAEQYVGRGLTVLALAYWGREGLPTALSHIPLEYGEKAALWLKARGYEKIGIAGISQGAVFSLLCASKMPELFSCAVGISPMCVCGQGLQKKNLWHKETKTLEGSSFSFRGEDIPCVPLKVSGWEILRDCLRQREFCLQSIYGNAAFDSPEEVQIRVEDISGPVLLLAADQDSMWQSVPAAERMIRRRAFQGKTTEYYHYPCASHYLLPYKLNTRKLFRVERKFPEECWKSNLDAFQKTLLFLRNSW